jgi:mRNA interferase MazF
LNRGSVVVAAEKGAFSGKPRPWLVIQNRHYLEPGSSLTVCMISSEVAPAFNRIAVSPTMQNGLEELSMVLVDKILTLRGQSVSRVIGQMDDSTMWRVDQALRLWLDL